VPFSREQVGEVFECPQMNSRRFGRRREISGVANQRLMFVRTRHHDPWQGLTGG